MSERTNADRARSAEEALLHYGSAKGYSEDEPAETVLVDLVADLRHLADFYGLDWDIMSNIAWDHHQCEVEDERNLENDAEERDGPGGVPAGSGAETPGDQIGVSL